MSRIGNKPIPVPDKVNITIKGKDVMVKGPKGELSHTVHPDINVKEEDGTLLVERPTNQREHRALHGLTRSLVANMVTGVSEGFRKTLLTEGVGYSAEVQGKNLVLRLGYSHDVVVEPPADVQFFAERGSGNSYIIHVDGIDKQVVGQVAANIREWRPPEPYKGKGVRYQDEHVRRKAGKAGKV
jgi:large subunit ribosomal protein L6